MSDCEHYWGQSFRITGDRRMPKSERYEQFPLCSYWIRVIPRHFGLVFFVFLSPLAQEEGNLFFNNGIMTTSSSASCSFAIMPLVDNQRFEFKIPGQLYRCVNGTSLIWSRIILQPAFSQESRNSFPNPVPRAALSSNLSLQPGYCFPMHSLILLDGILRISSSLEEMAKERDSTWWCQSLITRTHEHMTKREKGLKQRKCFP